MRKQPVRQLALSATIITGLFIGSVLHARVATAATYYVATNGKNANPGTQAQPFQTIAHGLSVLQAGDTLYLRGGTYNESIDANTFSPFPTGTSWGNAVTMASYPGETATLAPVGGNDAVINLPDAYLQYIIFDHLVIDAANVNHGGTFGSFYGYGVSLGSNGAHHIRFSNCDVKNAWATNFSPFGSNHEFLNNKVHDSVNSYGFYISHGAGVVLDGNEIYNNAGYAIQIYDGSYPSSSTNNNVVRNNIMYNNGFGRAYGAMVIGEGSGTTVYNNVIYNNWGGIQVRSTGSNITLYNNTIYGSVNEPGLRIDGSGTIIRNNIIYNNNGTITDAGSGTVQSNNLTTDPQFVDASANNFTLQSTSPSIDAGVAISEVTVDLNGTARAQGTGYDIGAYEYLASRLPAPRNLKAIAVAP